MLDAATRKRFEQLALAHLDAAYNLARRLTRNEQDAEDLVQEAYLRALQAFARFQGRALAKPGFSPLCGIHSTLGDACAHSMTPMKRLRNTAMPMPVPAC